MDDLFVRPLSFQEETHASSVAAEGQNWIENRLRMRFEVVRCAVVTVDGNASFSVDDFTDLDCAAGRCV